MAITVIKEKLGRVKVGKILDVATGDGWFARELARSFASFEGLIGIDTEQRQIDAAIKVTEEEKEKGAGDTHKFHFLKMNAEEMALPDHAFDVAGIANSLHHFSNPQKVLREMRRVVRPRGLVIVMEMFSDSLTPAQQSHDKLHRFAAKLDRLDDKVHHETFTRGRVIGLLDKVEFPAIESHTWTPPRSREHQGQDLPDRIEEIWTKRLKNYEKREEYPELKTELEEILSHILERGFAPAPTVIALCRC
jgi:ubiquinone/menaquinone biosynthesis C-methylase UbiE